MATAMLSSIGLSLANGLVFLFVLALLFIPADRVTHGFTIERSSVHVVAAPQLDRGIFHDSLRCKVFGDDENHEISCGEDGKNDESVSGSSTINESPDDESHTVVHTLLPKPLPRSAQRAQTLYRMSPYMYMFHS